MNNIAKIRKNKGITQQAVCEALSVCRTAVAKWEAGVAFPRADKLPKLAEIFGCTIDDLFREEGEK